MSRLIHLYEEKHRQFVVFNTFVSCRIIKGPVLLFKRHCDLCLCIIWSTAVWSYCYFILVCVHIFISDVRYFTYQVPLGPKKVRGHCCEVEQLWGLAARFALESWGVLDLVVLKTGQLTGSSLWGRAPLQYRSGSAEIQIGCDAANLILILVLIASLHRTCFSRQSRWIVTRYRTCRTLPFLFLQLYTSLYSVWCCDSAVLMAGSGFGR